MANNRFVFEGLEELKAELRALPAELAGEASGIVNDAGQSAAATVRAVYEKHRVTGTLANSVSVKTESAGTFGAAVIVKVNAAHAWLFDNGSQARHWVSGKSTGAMWGKTPPTHIFARTMATTRRRMYSQLRALLERHGLVVVDDEAA